MNVTLLGTARVRALIVGVAVLVAAWAGSAALAASAHAAFGLASFDAEALDADGTAATQAGGHPHTAATEFRLNTYQASVGEAPEGNLRNVRVDLPPGFVANPRATPQCALKDFRKPSDSGFAGSDLDYAGCPSDTQVGTVFAEFGGGQPSVLAPVYNMEPPQGAPAQLAFKVRTASVFIDTEVRTGGDYGASAVVRNVNQGLPLIGTTVSLWGVPADESHDADRGRNTAYYGTFPFPISDGDIPSGVPEVPFVTNPTSCTPAGVGLETRLRVESWDQPALVDEASAFSHLPAPQQDVQQGTDGCSRVPFDPQIDVQPLSRQPDAPAGYRVDLTIPHSDDPNGIAQSHLRKAVVTMPPGVTMSPSAADGLQGCSDEQIALSTDAPDQCPDAARIGTVSVETPLLDAPLEGSVYVGTQKPDDRYRIFLSAEGSGVVVKLAGSVSPDPQTGQLTTTFDNNPQLPFTKLRVEFKGGPRAPLANPPTCGTKTVTTSLTPWSGNAPATPSDTFEIDCPGTSGFAPRVGGGTVDATAGAFSPFVLNIDRDDRQQIMSGVRVELPEGLLARIKGVPLCSDAAAAAGACPEGSRVGTAIVGSGPGSSPFFLRGAVSLTGPYKGAPYGLAVVVRVLAGPFDLGTVVVRQALHVDPVTARVTVASDPLPTILEGVPIRLRSVNVEMDRPGFTVNPTSCAEKRIATTLTSTEGAVHSAETRFRVGDCASLRFDPKLALRLTGKRQTKTGGHPGLRAVVTQKAGEAGIDSTAVTLPGSMALDPNNSTDPKLLCGYDAGLKADCPASSVIGKATAQTPLLDRPLTGNVHLVQGIRFSATGNRIRTTPTLLVKLRGQIAIDLRAKTTVKGGRLATTFGEVPDAPVSRFSMSVNGGRKGILVVTRTKRAKIDICKSKQVATVENDGQNGKRKDFGARMKTPCAAKKSAKKSKRR